MDSKGFKQGFIKFIRIYPFIAVGLLVIAYLAGGFSQTTNPVIPRAIVTGFLYGLIGFVPVIIVLIFIVIGVSEDRARVRNLKNPVNHSQEDPFNLAHENMRGFKVVGLTGESPTFTGITGDTYKKDDSAICSAFPDHVPPVSGCECGFYAYKKRSDAQFELSIHPGLFLIDVDLFGIGYSHKHGYRAESQRVNSLILPKRCMRCKTLPARIFTRSYKIGFGNSSWWQWSVRCLVCAKTVAATEKLTIQQMSQKLQVAIN
jgi:uncharacterized membrane protein